jgi:hypothetical protein
MFQSGSHNAVNEPCRIGIGAMSFRHAATAVWNRGAGLPAVLICHVPEPSGRANAMAVSVFASVKHRACRRAARVPESVHDLVRIMAF